MGLPLSALTNEQKNWYARYVVAAVLADKEISVSEVEYIHHIMNVVVDPTEKAYLVEAIRLKRVPELLPPKGIKQEILTAIFIELILIMISDFDFQVLERRFLEKVSGLFGFSKNLFNNLITWAEKGLQWKNSRQFLIGDSITDPNLKVPVEKFNYEQKYWYALVLIATIICDGVVDKGEIRFINRAVSLVNDTEDQAPLLGYVRNKFCPPVSPPPDIPYVILIFIFIDLVLIITADETITVKELSHLKHVSDICDLTFEQYSKLLEWCKQGIQWKKSKTKFLTKTTTVDIENSNENVTQRIQIKQDSPIIILKRKCFVCNSVSEVLIYKLRSTYNATDHNIFDIPIYRQQKNSDYINFNLYRIAICPSCFFASDNRMLFKKDSHHHRPEILENESLRNK